MLTPNMWIKKNTDEGSKKLQEILISTKDSIQKCTQSIII